MKSVDLFATLAAANAGGSIVGFLVIVGFIWFLIAIFSKKPKYLVTQSTSVKKVK